MKRKNTQIGNKKEYVVRIPIVKDEVIKEEDIGNNKIKQTINRHVIRFYYCGQKNHTFTGDKNTMMVGGPDECKLYTKERARQVLADCCKYDKEFANYYRIERRVQKK